MVGRWMGVLRNLYILEKVALAVKEELEK